MNIDMLFTEESVQSISEKILIATREKIKDQIANEFYNQTELFLYEIYNNASEKIKNKLINDLVDEYVLDPANYKYQKIRNRLWLEHKAEIIQSLTDDGIKADVEKTLMQYTGNNYYFNWQWKDGIIKIILNNWDNFKNDERIYTAFGKKIDELTDYIKQLQDKINSLEIESFNQE